jgi:RNA polymerase sigma-70 factor (ECF subfamily)
MHPDELPRIAHDPQAFEGFYREHVEAVQRFVARRVDDPYLAADLTAEVFLAAIDAAAGYRPERGNPAAWLFGVAPSVLAGEHRRRARERHAHARLQGRRLLGDDDRERMRERIDAAARSRELFAAVAQLPDGERAVRELGALDDRSGTAAAVLGVRPVTARVRLHRARGALRRRLFDDDSPSVTQPLEAS